MTELKKPNIGVQAQKELDKAEKQFDEFNASVKELTMDYMNKIPKMETEAQTKLSQSELHNSKDIYLKPIKSIGTNQKFNENFREEYTFAKEYVKFIAEHKELIGETIEIWTRPYGGLPAEFWNVPTNKPIWGPRYLAEQINRKSHHKLVMSDKHITGADGMGQYYGAMAVDTTVERLSARPVSSKKSIFMGAGGF